MTEYTSGNRKKAYAAAVLFSFVVGFTFLAAKLLMGTVTPIEALAYRFNAALITALFVSMFNRDKICFRGRITSQLLLMSLLYCLFMLFQFAGLKYCTSIESGIIFALIPIIVQVLAAFFFERAQYGDTKSFRIYIRCVDSGDDCIGCRRSHAESQRNNFAIDFKPLYGGKQYIHAKAQRGI